MQIILEDERISKMAQNGLVHDARAAERLAACPNASSSSCDVSDLTK